MNYFQITTDKKLEYSSKVSYPVARINGTFRVDLSAEKYKRTTWAKILAWAVTENHDFIADAVQIDFDVKLDNNVSFDLHSR
jgi:hypothetical protein